VGQPSTSKRISQQFTHRTRQKFIDLSGKTDLLTLAALVGQAQLLVTVDSAPVHFAAASHTPQVILFGPDESVSLGGQR
jgi:ADP-heptose:LPS heptosyltransferase